MLRLRGLDPSRCRINSNHKVISAVGTYGTSSRLRMDHGEGKQHHLPLHEHFRGLWQI